MAVSDRFYPDWLKRWVVRPNFRPEISETLQPVLLMDEFASNVFGPVRQYLGAFVDLQESALERNRLYLNCNVPTEVGPIILFLDATPNADPETPLAQISVFHTQTLGTPLPTPTPGTGTQVNGSRLEFGDSLGVRRNRLETFTTVDTGPPLNTPRLSLGLLGFELHPRLRLTTGDILQINNANVNEPLRLDIFWQEYSTDPASQITSLNRV